MDKDIKEYLETAIEFVERDISNPKYSEEKEYLRGYLGALKDALIDLSHIDILKSKRSEYEK
jgi:hypothetical protein